ncbi:hypothetical protein FE257_004981 [Aspergillus nanangensis]|uniref:Zn(2)-C6 fungal-type domain-containing protein n=1 Tax=Aspergillus nanangensis TaxID=2582783 RepID=A0AAD4CQW2_ASPNN|nr:hypothetical protein FE257_004981 [Aspergillus nanangensis]
MVGVPHSNGCRACIQRHIKCDQTRPECRHCQTRAIRCPGYRRILRFYHFTPREDEFTDASALENSVARPTMDEAVAPNLIFEALDIQLKENFVSMIDVTFPVTYATFCRRVNPNWVSFVHHHSKAQPIALTLSFRCLSTWYLAVRHQDQEKIHASRHMYNRALRCLADLLRHPTTITSDSTLACAILLGVYEMWDGISATSWVIHARGIKTLFQLRGPEAHLDGFGRTLFTTYRSFLVVDAFQHNETCFLADPDWREMTSHALGVEERDGKGSCLGDVTENLFNEIILCPGFHKQTRDLISHGGSESSRDTLISEMRRSQSVLRRLHHELILVQNDPDKAQPSPNRGEVEAPFPAHFVPPITRFNLKGVDSALALLHQLLALLDADRRRTSSLHEGYSAGVENPWGAVALRLPGPIEDDGKVGKKPHDWLDHIAMTMGVLSIT